MSKPKSLETKLDETVKEHLGEQPEIESPLPKAGPANLHDRVKVEIINETESSVPPFQKHGEVVEMHKAVADKFEANGWGKIVSIAAILMFFAFGSFAQGTSYQKMAKVVSNLPTTAYKLIISDTVTNTGTNFLTTGYPQLTSYTSATYSGSAVAITTPALTTTVQANLTKISGTVAGTVTLQGSLDAANWTTVTGTTTGVQTGAFTATNVASQATVWTLVNSPYRFYRVTWTGTGTMAASMTAFVWSH